MKPCKGTWSNHTWQEWKVTERGKIINNMTKGEIGSFIVQERHCLLCGYTQLDRQETRLND